MSTATLADPSTAIDYPTCPTCAATGKSCRRPTGRTTAEWHADRIALLTPPPAEDGDDVVVEGPAIQPGTSLTHLHPAEIDPHPRNPRRDVGNVDELVDSIRALGVLEPLVVAPSDTPGRYLLIAGHRRQTAALKAGLAQVPCLVRYDLDTPARQLEAMLVENLHRADLTPVEEADGYQALLEFPGFTAASVAREVGQPLSRVRERLKLVKASEAVKTKLHAGQITISDALATLEFAGQKSIEQTLTKALGTDSFRHELARAREDAEHDRKLNARIQRLQAKGIKLSKRPADGRRIDQNHYYTAGIPLVEDAIGREIRDDDKVDAWVINHHAQCPGHVTALVDDGYRGRQTVAHLCTQPKLHPRSKGPAKSPEEAKKARAEAAARKKIAGDAAVAARLRRDHLHDRLLTIPDDKRIRTRMVTLVMARLDHAMAYTAAERAHQLAALAAVFGFELPVMPGRQKVQLEDIREDVHAVVKVLSLPSLVFCLDFFDHLVDEAKLCGDDPHGGGVHSRGHAWLTILDAHYDYTPSPFESRRFKVAAAARSDAFAEHLDGVTVHHQAFDGGHLLGTAECPCSPEVTEGHTHLDDDNDDEDADE